VELDRSVDLSRQATWHGWSQFSHFGVAYIYTGKGELPARGVAAGPERDSEIGSRQLVAQRRGTGRICLLPALSWPAARGTKGFAEAVRSTVMDTRSQRAGSPSHTNVPFHAFWGNSRDQGVEQESAASFEILAVMEDGAYAAFLIRHSNPAWVWLVPDLKGLRPRLDGLHVITCRGCNGWLSFSCYSDHCDRLIHG